MEEPDIQIGDTESYRSDKDLVYSHQSLIMKGKVRVLELGGHELCEGVNETIFDPMRKTTKVIYKEDTKRAFINAIKMTQAVMACDYDSIAEENIKALELIIENKLKECLRRQLDLWNKASQKQQKSISFFQKDLLHKELPFYNEFINFEIKVYIEIFTELNKLAQRNDFYSAEMFEA